MLANNKKILFCILLQNDENTKNKTDSAFIYFISITEEYNIEKYALDFINKYIFEDNEKFPYVESDKSGYFMGKDLFFSDKKKDNINNIEVFFPLKNLSIEKRTIFKTEIINKKIHRFFNKPEDFIIN